MIPLGVHGGAHVPPPSSGGGGWTPLDSSPLAWWDGAERSSMTWANGMLEAWTDRVNGHLLGPVGSARAHSISPAPIAEADAVGFKGSSVMRADWGRPLSQPFTVCVVANPTTLGNVPVLYASASSNEVWFWVGVLVSAGSSIYIPDPPLNDWSHFATVFNGDSSQHRQSGNDAIYGSIGSYGMSGGHFYLGSQSSQRYFHGSIAEVVVFEHALTDQELTDWGSYVNQKWGISA